MEPALDVEIGTEFLCRPDAGRDRVVGVPAAEVGRVVRELHLTDQCRDGYRRIDWLFGRRIDWLFGRRIDWLFGRRIEKSLIIQSDAKQQDTQDTDCDPLTAAGDLRDMYTPEIDPTTHYGCDEAADAESNQDYQHAMKVALLDPIMKAQNLLLRASNSRVQTDLESAFPEILVRADHIVQVSHSFNH